MNRLAALLAIILLTLLPVACNRGDEPTPAATATLTVQTATRRVEPATRFVETATPTPPPFDSSLPSPEPVAGLDTCACTQCRCAPQTATRPANATPVPIYGYEVVNVYPHDPGAFTQGLVVEGDTLVEGTGLYGQSSLRAVDLATGQVEEYLALPAEVFGEGITVFDDRVYQLTWREHIGFVYDRDSFQFLRTYEYPTEGWGITHDGQRLIMSDGSANLYFRDPETVAEIGRIEVRDANGPVVRLNELEFVDGEVWANIWQTDLIARIDLESGVVVGWIDLAGLLTSQDRQQPVDVLNGIAYDDETGRLFVTGKWWPKLFEIELAPAGGEQ